MKCRVIVGFDVEADHDEAVLHAIRSIEEQTIYSLHLIDTVPLDMEE